MKYLLLIFFTAISLGSYAQSELSNDTIGKINNNRDVQEYKPLSSSKSKEALDKINTDYQNNESASYDMPKDTLMKRLNLYIPSYYVGPGDDFKRIPTTNVLENNYGYYATWGISDRAWMNTASTQEVYPTLGASRNVSAMLSYQLSDQWIISGGPYASKYSIGGGQFNDMGMNGHLKFIAHDRIRFNVFGTYSVFGKDNSFGATQRGMFPQSSYGGTVEFKLTEKFGVETGIERILDPSTGKWKNIPIINPVFYVK